ncbi:MAG: lamin tail domain-containing protein [Thiobacillaceae bacterium]
MKKSLVSLITVFAAMSSASAHAAIVITEVAPWGSGNAPYATDWFELTNTGVSAINISGWQMDDNSNGTAKVNLTGISSIAAGESVIFTENAATTSFLNTWFGGAAPVGLQIGNYTGSGVGLSTTADAVNIYNAGGVLQANVTFGVSDATVPYQTFDNAAGLNNTAISQLSVVGVNGAFLASNDATEIGSPGTVTAVPEPANVAMMLAGIGVIGTSIRMRRR